MTSLLNKAFDAAGELSPEAQDQIARLILDELANDRRWDEAFANSQDTLAALADEALAEHRRGETKPLDPDKL